MDNSDMMATPQQADMLQGLLNEWQVLLEELELRNDTAEAMGESRKIYDNLSNNLKLDTESGIESVPASSLFKGISVANASIEKLQRIKNRLTNP